ncbi:MAG: hypothetical protein KGL39_41350 [Patescibacteria group bacterium]|nr:hypothetical protein [Patescibacteria group bacterium]
MKTFGHNRRLGLIRFKAEQFLKLLAAGRRGFEVIANGVPEQFEAIQIGTEDIGTGGRSFYAIIESPDLSEIPAGHDIPVLPFPVIQQIDLTDPVEELLAEAERKSADPQANAGAAALANAPDNGAAAPKAEGDSGEQEPPATRDGADAPESSPEASGTPDNSNKAPDDSNKAPSDASQAANDGSDAANDGTQAPAAPAADSGAKDSKVTKASKAAKTTAKK